jgi:hypothetical protein
MQEKHVEQQRSFLTSMMLMDFVDFMARGFVDCTWKVLVQELASLLLDWPNDLKWDVKLSPYTFVICRYP